jgi:hypothetical protein
VEDQYLGTATIIQKIRTHNGATEQHHFDTNGDLIFNPHYQATSQIKVRV